ncbi:uncharacterized protein SEPMUDRAFT_148091 [Sphaerulina musiva SO2202]|uniref:Uncharacterized protein n=1 Tax=Sphaerulina musiva (strain SO2202) TaxID=692275 RepID=M3CKR3_SPHMS|nr:uncharacterized protein SEPMUDRAFT_148091 [Sphaerulina musiva SO2202]EMF14358.1 hypothetical protein SEPMUDRAFT_148091 [Sphaerulina musiva SO2202]
MEVGGLGSIIISMSSSVNSRLPELNELPLAFDALRTSLVPASSSRAICEALSRSSKKSLKSSCACDSEETCALRTAVRGDGGARGI